MASTEVRLLQEQLNILQGQFDILATSNEALRKQANNMAEALRGYNTKLKSLVDLIEFSEKEADALSMSVNILRRDVARGAAAVNLLPFWEQETKKAVEHRNRLRDVLESFKALHSDVHFRAYTMVLL